MTRRTRAQRAARIRALEGVPDHECLCDMGLGYGPADCDCGICAQQPDEEDL